MFQITFMFTFLLSASEVSWNYSNRINNLSYFTSLGFIIFIVLVVASIPLHYSITKRDESVLTSGIGRSFYSGNSTNSPYTSLQLLFFFLRRIILISLIIYLQNKNFYIKMILIFSTSALSLFYYCKFLPFQSPFDNMIQILNEMSLVILGVLLTINRDKENWKDWMKVCLLVYVTLCLFSTLIIQILVNCKRIYHSVKNGVSEYLKVKKTNRIEIKRSDSLKRRSEIFKEIQLKNLDSDVLDESCDFSSFDHFRPSNATEHENYYFAH